MLTLLLTLAVAAAVPSVRTVEASRPAPSKLRTACRVVTQTDVEQALGRIMDAGTEELGHSLSTCDYTGRNGLVTVTVQRTEPGIDYRIEIAGMTAAIPGAKVREVQSLGHRAFFLDIPDAGTQLHILHGRGGHLMISVLGFGDATSVSAAAERIARLALNRLQ